MSVIRLFPWFWDSAKSAFSHYVRRPFWWLMRSFHRVFPFLKTNRVKNPALITSATPDLFEFMAIGKIKSIYKEKFGTPRQGNLVPHGRGCLILDKRAVDIKWSLDALDQFSHVWLIFIFHENTNNTGKRIPMSKVRPPQGAGNKIGVFATRSPHRPNPVGLTMARITRVDVAKGIVYLDGLDLCEGTPVIDLKPYCEHVDWPGQGIAITPRWVTNPKFERTPVTFSNEATESLKRYIDIIGVCEWYKKGESEEARQAIEEIISLDPRDLNRGRGAFTVESGSEDVVPVKDTAFSRRGQKAKLTAVTRLTYVRFDELDVTFKPDDVSRSFHIVSVDLYKDREIIKKERSKAADA